MMALPYTVLMKKKILYEINPRGKVVSVTGGDKILDEILEKYRTMNTDVTDEDLKKLREELSNTISDKAFKNNFEESFLFYPDKKIPQNLLMLLVGRESFQGFSAEVLQPQASLEQGAGEKFSQEKFLPPAFPERGK